MRVILARVTSHSGSGSPAAGRPAAQDSRWQPEAAVRAALREHWGLHGGLRRMEVRPASLTWQVGDHVVKLARDEPTHFTAGLRASEVVERAGIASGAPVRTRAGELCVPLRQRPEPWALAVLRRVGGGFLSPHDVAPALMGECLGRVHRILRGCPAVGAWTPGDVLGHGQTPGSPTGMLQPPVAPLSHSEIRVLRYFPTNLSMPEIANELSVSHNTVRTHMRHVYAKLGTHRRAATVERGRALGLLAPSPLKSSPKPHD